MSRPKLNKLVVISCRGPLGLRKKIQALAKKAKRSRSDWLRLTLTEIVNKSDDQAGRDAAA